MTRKQDLDDRLTRAKSWIEAARSLPPDQKHAAFVFLYVAYNALYGQRRYEGSEKDAQRDREEFLRRVWLMHAHDMRHGENILQRAFEACRDQGLALIKDIFLRNTYWRHEVRAKELRKRFSRLAKRAEDEMKAGRHEEFLDLVLQRLAVLRNQIMHGCATYGPNSKGIASLENGLAVLRELVPAFRKLMSRYGQHVDWPAVPYPRVGSERHPAVDQFTEQGE